MVQGRVQIEIVTVRGRPQWSRDEPAAVQRLAVEHKLTHGQFKALRDFARNPAGIGAPMTINASLARSLVRRGLGEVESTFGKSGGDRAHPKHRVRLLEAGMKLASALTVQPADTIGGVGAIVAAEGDPR